MSERVFEGIDWAKGRDRGYHVVTIGPDATPEDVQAFRDAYELGCAWAEAEAALPEGWWLDGLYSTRLPEGITWEAVACEADYQGAEDRHHGVGPTPAAALRALAAKLRGRAG